MTLPAAPPPAGPPPAGPPGPDPDADDDRDPGPVLALFEGFGVELEAMIVDAKTLAVRPIADLVLEDLAGRQVDEVARGPVRLSNELVMHVLEVKTNGPAPGLGGVAGVLREALLDVDRRLAQHGARLLPGAMHPTMDPTRETSVWFHQNDEIYAAFDRIFGVRAHGWANLQSVHLNLPFQGDEELRVLHEAVRLVLPILPALSAGSPVVEGRISDVLDHRLQVYQGNARRIPAITGRVVPEPITGRAHYQATILDPIYAAIAPYDPQGTLQHEWLNARGAIVRFDRSAIEIRTIDAQEGPEMDLAVLAATVTVLRDLVGRGLAGEGPCAPGRPPLDTAALAAILDATIREGEQAVVDDPNYLDALGLTRRRERRAGGVWETLLFRAPLPRELDRELGNRLALILDEGPLARRMRRFVGPDPTPRRIRGLIEGMADAFRAGKPFVP